MAAIPVLLHKDNGGDRQLYTEPQRISTEHRKIQSRVSTARSNYSGSEEGGSVRIKMTEKSLLE